MTLKLRLEVTTSIPVEVEGVNHDAVRERSLADIQKMEVFHGNRRLPLAELFKVSGDPSDGRIEWEGDMSGVHWIGAKMTAGTVRVSGNVGRHLGSEMSGGEIDVAGDASDWVGGEMHGGLIHVRGSAGHLVGAAYRGSRRGMTGGVIFVGGDVGNEIGHTMRRGLLTVRGSCGDLSGFNMIAGTVLVFGDCGIRQGAGMRRGTIGLLGRSRPQLLPSFRYACRLRPMVLAFIMRSLQEKGFLVPQESLSPEVDLYNGDIIEGGRGEILMRPESV